MSRLGSLVLLLLSGCSIPLMGAGEIGVGWTTTQKVYFYHTVDGDKDGKKSEAKLDLNSEEDPERCQEPATGK